MKYQEYLCTVAYRWVRCRCVHSYIVLWVPTYINSCVCDAMQHKHTRVAAHLQTTDETRNRCVCMLPDSVWVEMANYASISNVTGKFFFCEFCFFFRVDWLFKLGLRIHSTKIKERRQFPFCNKKLEFCKWPNKYVLSQVIKSADRQI